MNWKIQQKIVKHYFKQGKFPDKKFWLEGDNDNDNDGRFALSQLMWKVRFHFFLSHLYNSLSNNAPECSNIFIYVASELIEVFLEKKLINKQNLLSVKKVWAIVWKHANISCNLITGHGGWVVSVVAWIMNTSFTITITQEYKKTTIGCFLINFYLTEDKVEAKINAHDKAVFKGSFKEGKNLNRL